MFPKKVLTEVPTAAACGVVAANRYLVINYGSVCVTSSFFGLPTGARIMTEEKGNRLAVCKFVYGGYESMRKTMELLAVVVLLVNTTALHAADFL